MTERDAPFSHESERPLAIVSVSIIVAHLIAVIKVVFCIVVASVFVIIDLVFILLVMDLFVV